MNINEAIPYPNLKSPNPAAHYTTFNHLGLSTEDQHHHWLKDIRETIWFRTKFENEVVASNDALVLHWKRACWVLHLWGQADSNNMSTAIVSDYGWKINNSVLTIKWDTDDNMKRIQERISSLVKGCKCVTGCTTNRCKCRKMAESCSAGCECINCNNTSSSSRDTPSSMDTSSSSRDTSSSSRDTPSSMDTSSSSRDTSSSSRDTSSSSRDTPSSSRDTPSSSRDTSSSMDTSSSISYSWDISDLSLDEDRDVLIQDTDIDDIMDFVFDEDINSYLVHWEDSEDNEEDTLL